MMAIEDAPSPSEEQINDTPTPLTLEDLSVDYNKSTSGITSVHKLVADLQRILETQEVALFSISSTDVHESVVDHLARAKAENRTARDKLAEVLESLKNAPPVNIPPQTSTPLMSSMGYSDQSSIFSPPLSPIHKSSDTKQPNSSPLSKSLSYTKEKHKRFSFGGLTRTSDSHNMSSSSTDDSMDGGRNVLSMSMNNSRPKKEKRSLTQFLTLKSTRTIGMPHSNSASSLHSSITPRAELPVRPLSPDVDRRLARITSDNNMSKNKEKLPHEDEYSLQIHETSRMLFERKRNLLQQSSSGLAAAEIST